MSSRHGSIMELTITRRTCDYGGTLIMKGWWVSKRYWKCARYIFKSAKLKCTRKMLNYAPIRGTKSTCRS